MLGGRIYRGSSPAPAYGSLSSTAIVPVYPERQEAETMLLAQRLQQAGIGFVVAIGKHSRDGTVAIKELACTTDAERDKARAWAERENIAIDTLRVATPEEIADSENAW